MARLTNTFRKDPIVPAAGGLIALLVGAGLYRAQQRNRISHDGSAVPQALQPPPEMTAPDGVDAPDAFDPGEVVDAPDAFDPGEVDTPETAPVFPLSEGSDAPANVPAKWTFRAERLEPRWIETPGLGTATNWLDTPEPQPEPEGVTGKAPDATKVGDWVQWESNGIVQFDSRRVDWVSDDGQFARVEGSLTGLPVTELSVVAPPAPAAQPERAVPADLPVPDLLDEAPGADRVPEFQPRGDAGRWRPRAFQFSFRNGALFAAGLLLGAVAAAWIALELPESPPAPEQPERTQTQTQAPAQQPAAVGAAAHQQAVCLQEPAIAAAGDKDGRVRPNADVSATTAGDVTALLASGKEAAAQGRSRDAELSLLMACRAADKLKGAESEDAADARYQLARHYANQTLSGDAAGRTALLKRAEILYADSLKTYLGKYGDGHEKSRLAGEGLKGVWQTLASADARAAPVAATPGEPGPAAAPETAAAAAPEPEPEPAVAPGAAAPKVAQAASGKTVRRVAATQKRAQTAGTKAAPVSTRTAGQSRANPSRAVVYTPQPRTASQRSSRVAVAPRRARP